MSAAGRQLSKPGKFFTHRTLTGALSADSTDYTNATFAVANAFFGDDCDSIWVYWVGDGGAIADTLTFEVLVRDGANNVWVATTPVVARRQRAVEIPVRGAAQVFVRIDAFSGTSTNPVIRVAKAIHESE